MHKTAASSSRVTAAKHATIGDSRVTASTLSRVCVARARCGFAEPLLRAFDAQLFQAIAERARVDPEQPRRPAAAAPARCAPFAIGSTFPSSTRDRCSAPSIARRKRATTCLTTSEQRGSRPSEPGPSSCCALRVTRCCHRQGRAISGANRPGRRATRRQPGHTRADAEHSLGWWRSSRALRRLSALALFTRAAHCHRTRPLAPHGVLARVARSPPAQARPRMQSKHFLQRW